MNGAAAQNVEECLQTPFWSMQSALAQRENLDNQQKVWISNWTCQQCYLVYPNFETIQLKQKFPVLLGLFLTPK